LTWQGTYPVTQDSHLHLGARSCGPWLSLLPYGVYGQEIIGNDYVQAGVLKSQLGTRTISWPWVGGNRLQVAFLQVRCVFPRV
jgi:hypothetical protein